MSSPPTYGYVPDKSTPLGGENLRTVALVSGQQLQVMGDEEQTWFEQSRDKYLTETKFTEATDLRDLDRLLGLELMVHRWSRFLAAGVDYEGQLINERQLASDTKAYSQQINELKKSMGLTKAARDEALNSENFAGWLADLKTRAKLFGVHRERQLTKSLALMEELSALLGAFDRADTEERMKLGIESETVILDWIRHTMLPEYRQIDEHFRKNEQRYWVRSQ